MENKPLIITKSFLKKNSFPLILSFGVFFLTFFGTILVELWKVGFKISPDLLIVDEINISQNATPWNEILIHNFIVLLPVLLGVFNLGLLSFWYIILQGYLLGVTVSILIQEFPISFIFKYTLAHGVFEFLAIGFLGAFAFKPGVLIIDKVILNKRVCMKSSMKQIGLLFFLFLFFLLISAIVEGFITPYL
ncbi:stage II sporulation protein M [Bacillus sp. FJAT-45037]|uniref:stage II sporulation protein M n=1 Tax=Bacillus sp. FJAT-45037 TaxID=2011007 RepID=UPI000C239C05|nr:stage II sporulation protein M [Bacillus sp. FJAT-45037]